MKFFFIKLILITCTVNIFAQLRSFNDIFPNMNQNDRNSVFSDSGYLKTSKKSSGFTITGQNARLDPQIINTVLSKNPGYVVESIKVIPGTAGTVTLLDIYNALGKIQGLKGRLYSSHSKGQEVPLFDEATRITSERNTNAIADPAPARTLPQSETVYIRLKDTNFGNTFYRGEMSLVQNGLRYTMSNFRSMTYMLVPVIRENKFTAQLYFEPIQEGVLIYSLAGTDISDFFASKIHIESAISKRLDVITSWASDGIINKPR